MDLLTLLLGFFDTFDETPPPPDDPRTKLPTGP